MCSMNRSSSPRPRQASSENWATVRLERRHGGGPYSFWWVCEEISSRKRAMCLTGRPFDVLAESILCVNGQIREACRTVIERAPSPSIGTSRCCRNPAARTRVNVISICDRFPGNQSSSIVILDSK
jgi:hypothetical protein